MRLPIDDDLELPEKGEVLRRHGVFGRIERQEVRDGAGRAPEPHECSQQEECREDAAHELRRNAGHAFGHDGDSGPGSRRVIHASEAPSWKLPVALQRADRVRHHAFSGSAASGRVSRWTRTAICSPGSSSMPMLCPTISRRFAP